MGNGKHTMKKNKKRKTKITDWFNFTYIAMITAIVIFVKTGHNTWAIIFTSLIALSYILVFLIYILIHYGINAMLEKTNKQLTKLAKIKKEIDETNEDARYY